MDISQVEHDEFFHLVTFEKWDEVLDIIKKNPSWINVKYNGVNLKCFFYNILSRYGMGIFKEDTLLDIVIRLYCGMYPRFAKRTTSPYFLLLTQLKKVFDFFKNHNNIKHISMFNIFTSIGYLTLFKELTTIEMIKIQNWVFELLSFVKLRFSTCDLTEFIVEKKYNLFNNPHHWLYPFFIYLKKIIADCCFLNNFKGGIIFVSSVLLELHPDCENFFAYNPIDKRLTFWKLLEVCRSLKKPIDWYKYVTEDNYYFMGPFPSESEYEYVETTIVHSFRDIDEDKCYNIVSMYDLFDKFDPRNTRKIMFDTISNIFPSIFTDYVEMK